MTVLPSQWNEVMVKTWKKRRKNFEQARGNSKVMKQLLWNSRHISRWLEHVVVPQVGMCQVFIVPNWIEFSSPYVWKSLWIALMWFTKTLGLFGGAFSIAENCLLFKSYDAYWSHLREQRKKENKGCTLELGVPSFHKKPLSESNSQQEQVTMGNLSWKSGWSPTAADLNQTEHRHLRGDLKVWRQKTMFHRSIDHSCTSVDILHAQTMMYNPLKLYGQKNLQKTKNVLCWLKHTNNFWVMQISHFWVQTKK